MCSPACLVSEGPLMDIPNKQWLISPQRARAFLERLGPTFIKLGQYLSLRPDLVAPPYANEFLYLQDKVPADPFEVSMGAIRDALGREPTDVFAVIDPDPVGSASLSQVYRAVTYREEEVAVKIIRFNIKERIAKDLKRLRLIATIFRLIGVKQIVSFDEVVSEVSAWLHREVDLEGERDNLTRFYLNGQNGNYHFRVPKPYPEYSRGGVLTMEFVRGNTFVDLLRYDRYNSVELGIEKVVVNRNELVRNYLLSIYEQMFRDGFFHADVHPGNIFITGESGVVFVDCALCETLDQVTTGNLTTFVSAVVSGEFAKMFSALLGIVIPGPDADLTSLRQRCFQGYIAFLTEKESRSELADSKTQSAIVEFMLEVIQSVRLAGYRVPPRILTVYRVLLVAESTAFEIDRSVGLVSVGREYFAGLEAERVIAAFAPAAIRKQATQLLELLQDGPPAVQQTLSDIANDRLILRVMSSEAPELAKRENRRTRLIALAIVLVALSVLLASGRASFGATNAFGSIILVLAMCGLGLYIVLLSFRL
jgi:ubiquinone biosynthesis protein